MRQEKAELSIFGIKVSRVGIDELHRAVEGAVSRRTKSLILNVNIHCIVIALQQPWLKDFLNQAPVVYCDGDGVRWGIRMLGDTPPPKVGFTRWIWDLAAFCRSRDYRLYLLGGAPGVAEQAGDALCARYPGLKIAGTYHGYFAKDGFETDEVIRKINQLKPDILVIGFGMPVQEKWLKENWQKIEAFVFLPGGAVLDYAAGKLGQAPRWMIRFHLEWLFRIWEDPKRLAKRYAFDIPFFFLRVLGERIRRFGVH